MSLKRKRIVRKPSIALKSISFMFGIAILAISVTLVTGTVKEIMNNRRLSSELAEARGTLNRLSEEKSSLTEEKINLEDPSYVQNYARGTHLLSKSGETIFIIPNN